MGICITLASDRYEHEETIGSEIQIRSRQALEEYRKAEPWNMVTSTVISTRARGGC